MKRIIIIVAILFLSLSQIYSQTDENKNTGSEGINTLFGGNKIHTTFYLAPQVKLTSINSELGVLAGGRGGLTFNKTFSIGLAGYKLLTEHDVNYTDLNNKLINSSIDFGYGGLFFEYIYAPTEVVHLSGNVLLGYGGTSYRNLNRNRFIDTIMTPFEHYNMRDTIQEPWVSNYIIEPTVAAEFNITKFFRLGLEASYRIVGDLSKNQAFKNTSALQNIKMSGLAGALTLQFGWF